MEGIHVKKNSQSGYLPYYFIVGDYWFHTNGRKEGRHGGASKSIFKLGGPKCLIKW